MTLLALIFAAAAETFGSASAQGIDLKGGMSLIDGSMITAIFTGMAAVIGSIGTILWRNHRDKVKAEIPQPCEVHQQNDCVTVKECNRRMKSLEDRMDMMEQRFAGGFENILKKLDAMDKRSEDRAIALNRRIDPMMEKLAECRGQVDLIKDQVSDAWKSATVGGKK